MAGSQVRLSRYQVGNNSGSRRPLKNSAVGGNEGVVIDALNIVAAIQAVTPDRVDSLRTTRAYGPLVRVLIAGKRVLSTARIQDAKLLSEIDFGRSWLFSTDP